MAEPLPAPAGNGSGGLQIVEEALGVHADGTPMGHYVWSTGIPGHHDVAWAPLYENHRHPDMTFLECAAGTCVGEIVTYIFPHEHHPNMKVEWPQPVDWTIEANVASVMEVGSPSAALEVISTETVLMQEWEVATDFSTPAESDVLWQSVHFEVLFPAGFVPNLSDHVPSLMLMRTDEPGFPDRRLDGGLRTVWDGDGVACEPAATCESVGFALLPDRWHGEWKDPSGTVRMDGVHVGADGPPDNLEFSVESTDADRAVRFDITDGLEDEHGLIQRFTVTLDHLGHRDGWPVIAYFITSDATPGSLDNTKGPVLADCRHTPCTGEFSIRYDDKPEWVEFIVVPWASESTDGMSVTVSRWSYSSAQS